MRRAFLPALMISLVVLTGCSSAESIEERFDTARAELLAAEEISFDAAIHANLADSVFDCTVNCVTDGDEISLTVTEPELISGITVKIRGDDTKMEYDGLQLYVGKTRGDLAPIEAVPLITEALLRGFATDYYTELDEEGGELLAVRVYIDESSYALLHMDGESMELIHGEIVVGEQAVLQAKISNFIAR